MASARASASPAFTRQPVRPSSGCSGALRTVSGTAPRFETTTIAPIACASTAVRPNASGAVDGTATTTRRRNAAGISSQWPTQRDDALQAGLVDQRLQLADVAVAALRVARQDVAHVAEPALPFSRRAASISTFWPFHAVSRAATSTTRSCGATPQASRSRATRARSTGPGENAGEIRAARNDAQSVARAGIESRDQRPRCIANWRSRRRRAPSPNCSAA